MEVGLAHRASAAAWARSANVAPDAAAPGIANTHSGPVRLDTDDEVERHAGHHREHGGLAMTLTLKVQETLAQMFGAPPAAGSVPADAGQDASSPAVVAAPAASGGVEAELQVKLRTGREGVRVKLELEMSGDGVGAPPLQDFVKTLQSALLTLFGAGPSASPPQPAAPATTPASALPTPPAVVSPAASGDATSAVVPATPPVLPVASGESPAAPATVGLSASVALRVRQTYGGVQAQLGALAGQLAAPDAATKAPALGGLLQALNAQFDTLAQAFNGQSGAAGQVPQLGSFLSALAAQFGSTLGKASTTGTSPSTGTSTSTTVAMQGSEAAPVSLPPAPAFGSLRLTLQLEASARYLGLMGQGSANGQALQLAA